MKMESAGGGAQDDDDGPERCIARTGERQRVRLNCGGRKDEPFWLKAMRAKEGFVTPLADEG